MGPKMVMNHIFGSVFHFGTFLFFGVTFEGFSEEQPKKQKWYFHFLECINRESTLASY